jgi:hypothetical protein
MTTWDGTAEFDAALAATVERVNAAAVRIVRRGETVLEEVTKSAFSQQHRRGTQTPSAPGSPPAVVTGALRRSVVSDAVRFVGTAATGQVYPSVVYGRIQELGGRGLPPRPFLAPSIAATEPRYAVIASEEWALALRV